MLELYTCKIGASLCDEGINFSAQNNSTNMSFKITVPSIVSTQINMEVDGIKIYTVRANQVQSIEEV